MGTTFYLNRGIKLAIDQTSNRKLSLKTYGQITKTVNLNLHFPLCIKSPRVSSQFYLVTITHHLIITTRYNVLN